jgi:hypothetical protein
MTGVGGALLLATGVLGLLAGLFFLVFIGYPYHPYYGYGYGHGMLLPYILCPAIVGVFSIFAILGGICCLQKKNFPLAIVGAVLGIFTYGFGIGSILSILALIFIAISKNAFRE